MSMIRIVIIMAALVTSVLGTGPVVQAGAKGGAPAYLAWPEYDGERSEIFFNEYKNGQWLGTKQITNNQYDNMHPKMALRPNGELWLVWTALNGLKNKLFYAVREEGSWSYPREIETGLQSGIGPTITMDGQGNPWIAWAGYNGVADDIYVSHWDGRNWARPVQVNPANRVPDILPEISLNEQGKLQVIWDGYDGNLYQRYISILEKDGWSAPVELPREEQDATSLKTAKTAADKEELTMPSSFQPIENDPQIYHLLRP